MNANPFTQVSIPTTLFDLLDARTEALRLIADARRTLAMAKEALAPHGAHLFPYDAEMREDQDRVRRELDGRLWRRAFDLTGFKQLMDAEAVKDFENSLSPNPPEFTDATIRATFIDLLNNARSMFQRGVFNVFRYLSDDYRTNAKEPFRIGAKVIMDGMVEMSFRRGLCLRYGTWAKDKLNDIDRVFQTLDGQPFQANALTSAMDVAFEAGEVFDNDYYRAKAFKKGSLHLEFKRQDLLDKVNEQIAAFYADGALPDARAA